MQFFLTAKLDNVPLNNIVLYSAIYNANLNISVFFYAILQFK